MTNSVSQLVSKNNAAKYSDFAFSVLIETYCDALNHFARLRGWPPYDAEVVAVTREDLRAAAQALREAIDRLADLPEWIDDDEPSGATLSYKAKIAGDLLVESETNGEPWLAELATRLVKRAVAVERGEEPAAELERLAGGRKRRAGAPSFPPTRSSSVEIIGRHSCSRLRPGIRVYRG